ncbi:MAG: alpha/beta fold hydrolase [Nocardioides sp.]
MTLQRWAPRTVAALAVATIFLVVASADIHVVEAQAAPGSRHGSQLDEWCLGAASDEAEGTPAWAIRDAMNMVCAEQRLVEAAGNALVAGGSPLPLRDTYRDPVPLDGHRFRYDTTLVRNRAGSTLATEIFRPCTARTCTRIPAGVERHRGPYPTVVIVHGGAANKEMHWWASEALAEHGYMVIAFDVAENAGGDHATDAQDMLDWLNSSSFPFEAELDPARIGIAGHSQGASTASLLAQIDPRIDAFVAWDNLTALERKLWEDDIGVLPPRKVKFHSPGLGIAADYYFAPRPFSTAPEPAASNGEGGRGRGFSAHPKHLGFDELRREGIDTMLFVLRAGTHLDFTPALSGGASSRHGEAVSTYLTLAWFDRYLFGDPRRARKAFHRLVVARRFDDSADTHAYGSGLSTPRGNRPTLIEGLPMCDRMSFYFRSRYSLRPPGRQRRVTSISMRDDCLKSR